MGDTDLPQQQIGICAEEEGVKFTLRKEPASESEVSLQHAVEVSAGTYRGQLDRRIRDEANFLLCSGVLVRSVRQSGKPDEGAALNVFLIRAFSVRVFFVFKILLPQCRERR